MSYSVYSIKSKRRNYIYVGITDDLERRLSQHNKGYNRITKPYRPFKVVTIEKFNSRIRARKREKYLKSGCGKEYIKSLIK